MQFFLKATKCIDNHILLYDIINYFKCGFAIFIIFYKNRNKYSDCEYYLNNSHLRN
jgi:hypothetical protein